MVGREYGAIEKWRHCMVRFLNSRVLLSTGLFVFGLLGTVLFISPTRAQAATVTWTGASGTDTSWSTASN